MDKKKRPNMTQTDKGDRNAYQNTSESICDSTKQSKMYEDRMKCIVNMYVKKIWYTCERDIVHT